MGYGIERIGGQGIWLSGAKIALDGMRAEAEWVCVSHAHADHVPRSRRLPVHATPATAALMRARGFTGPIEAIPFGQTFGSADLRITFFPAGHILGSALTLVESEAGRLLYTGDCRTPASPTSEGFDCPSHVDELITEATFSLPIYKWKPHADLAGQIATFARESLAAGAVPVFQAYNLGKAQEIMHILAQAGVPTAIHEAGFALCGIYESFGIPLGDYRKHEPGIIDGRALITPYPPNDGDPGRYRTAYVSGWAVLEKHRAASGADALIPLSDHLDFFELLALVERLGPRLTHITHTPNPDIVRHYLAARGLESRYLA